MARGINKVILIGNLGADPEVRHFPSGGATTSVNLATTDTWKNKETGEAQEKTEWHRLVFFNRLAEIVGQYLRKGSKVYVEGSLRTRKYTDKNGIERYVTEIIVNEMSMLDSRNTGQEFKRDAFEGSTSEGAPDNLPQETLAQSPQFEEDDIPF